MGDQSMSQKRICLSLTLCEMWENTDQKKLRIWTRFTQCNLSHKNGCDYQ